MKIDKKCIIVNQAKDGQEEEIRKRAKEFGLEVSGIIPEDPLVRQFDLEGKPTTELNRESGALKAAFTIFDALLAE